MTERQYASRTYGDLYGMRVDPEEQPAHEVRQPPDPEVFRGRQRPQVVDQLLRE